MFKTFHINDYKENKKLTCDKEIINYLNPLNIYIPLIDNNITYKPLVNINEYVCKGQVIARSDDGNNFPIHSSVSGIVSDLNYKMWTNNGKLINCISISNDFKEKFYYKKYDVVDKTSFIELLKENGIVGLGGSGFFTYRKYINSNIDTLIVNGCECEPFISCDYRLMIERIYDLIEGIKIIKKYLNIKNVYICIKNNKLELIKSFEKFINKDINLILLKDKYPVGWEKYLVYKCLKKKYKSYPFEVGCVVNNTSTIISIYDAFVYSKPLIERVVTFTGTCLENPINVNVKIGTSVNEVLNFLGGINNNILYKSLTVGGLFTGKSMSFDNICITKSTNAIIINELSNNNFNSFECIGCGKCSDVCPVYLSPILIKIQYIDKNKNELKELKSMNCINCGLCSYICPSKVDLSFFTNKSKELLLKERQNEHK